jgi:hypothetical protein
VVAGPKYAVTFLYARPHQVRAWAARVYFIGLNDGVLPHDSLPNTRTCYQLYAEAYSPIQFEGGGPGVPCLSSGCTALGELPPLAAAAGCTEESRVVFVRFLPRI